MTSCLAGVKTAQEFFRAKETSKKDVNYFIDRFVFSLLLLTALVLASCMFVHAWYSVCACTCVCTR